MRWVVVVPIAVSLWAGAAFGAPAPTVISMPDWVRKPTAEELEDAYPKVAQFLTLDGRAMINCEISAQGLAQNCTVESEAPTGMRFGEAAISLSRTFQMKPMVVDGKPVGGGRVRVPIRFIYPRAEDELALVADTAPATTPAPKSLDLARRITAVELPDFASHFIAAQMRENTKNQFAGLSLTPQEQAGIDDYIAALAGAVPALAEARAQRLASRLSDRDLAAIATFMETGPGRAYAAALASSGKDAAADLERVWAGVRKSTAEAFCRDHDCPPPISAPAAPTGAPGSP